MAHSLADLAWYARTRNRAGRWHQTVELSALLTGAGTVVAAGLQAPAAITAVMAGATVFIGGFRQVFNHLERYVLAAEARSRLHLTIQRYTLVPESERDEATRGRLLDEIEAVTMAELRGPPAAAGTQSGHLPGGPPPA
ncbi:SLATT domain-containing protein [Streptomyces sp. NPDC059851]|uniref:SLATT domain-containing protein n=1 Tax=Streptomyces sp. NPDC059851 TaxID=3346971 RepID=UPI003647E8F1